MMQYLALPTMDTMTLFPTTVLFVRVYADDKLKRILYMRLHTLCMHIHCFVRLYVSIYVSMYVCTPPERLSATTCGRAQEQARHQGEQVILLLVLLMVIHEHRNGDVMLRAHFFKYPVL